MDITKLATRFAEIYASNSKKSVSSLEKELEKAGFGDDHAKAASLLRSTAHTLRDMAFMPSKTEVKALEKSGVEVRVMKDKSWQKCLDGYTIVSDLRGEEPDMYSNGYVLEKGGKTFYASCFDSSDSPPAEDMGASPLEKFTEAFGKTVRVTKHAQEGGATLPIADTFVCFHSEGFFGCIVFEGKKTTKLWHAHINDSIKGGHMYDRKNRKVVAEINAKIGPIAKKKMDNLHDKGIIFAFRGYGWLDTSGIVLDMDGDKPVDIFPMNYTSSALVNDLVKDATMRDYQILDYMQDNYAEKRDKAKLIINLAAVKLMDEGLIKM
jgi:hypothetical protein